MFIKENVPKLNHIKNTEVTSFGISMMTSVFSERGNVKMLHKENAGLIIRKSTIQEP